MDTVRAAARAAQEKKADNIVALDIRKVSTLCDFQLICEAKNEKQAQAITDHIRLVLKNECQLEPFAVEGHKEGNWILIDYGSFLIHVFRSEHRSYYNLEQLWPDCAVKLER